MVSQKVFIFSPHRQQSLLYAKALGLKKYYIVNHFTKFKGEEIVMVFLPEYCEARVLSRIRSSVNKRHVFEITNPAGAV